MAEGKPVEVEETDSGGDVSQRSPALRDLIRHLVKAQKALRLYEANNAIAHGLEKALYAELFAHLEEQGEFELTVQEFKMLLGEDILYESNDRKDSLSFTLFRDGVRKISFHPGIEDRELHGFLTCLNRVGMHSNDQDDLVTLFWEQDFKSIKYYAIEELSSESAGPSLQQQLESGASGEGGGGGASPDSVSLKDLEQPNAHLPNDAGRLTEDELEALRAELLAQETEPFCGSVVELAIELTLQERRKEERDRITDSLIAIANRLLKDGELEEIARLAEHLEGLSGMLLSDSEPVTELRKKVFRALSDPEHLGGLLDQVEQARQLKPSELTMYLARLGTDALPALVPSLARLNTSPFRRAVAEAIVATKEEAVPELSRHIPTNGDVPDVTFVRELLYVLSHLAGDQSLPLVEKFLSASDEVVRREAASTLGRFDHERTGELCLKLLSDPDAEVRNTALDTLVRSGATGLAKLILERSITNPAFEERSFPEKSRTFSAVAKLGGPEALDWFADIVRPGERRWFASRSEREMLQAAVHGIRKLGTPEAKQLLDEMASKGDRFVRAASQKELSTERKA